MRSTSLALVSLFVLVTGYTSALGDDFTILFVSPETDSAITEAYVLVAGGYVHGLETGMHGSVLACGKDDDTVIIGTAELVDVCKYESSCLVRRLAKEHVRIGHTVIFEPPETNQEMFIELGREAFEAKDFERAQYFLQKALPGTTPQDSLELAPLVKESTSKVEKELKRKLRRKERKQEEKKETAYLILAQHYLTELDLAPARYYLNKLVRLYPGESFAKEMIARIDELHEFKGEAAGHFPDDTGVEIFPKMIKIGKPVYPKVARLVGLQGTVWVKALVARTGKVMRATVHRSCGYPILDNAAVASAYMCEFEPGIRKGETVNCWATWRINFVIESAGSRY